MKISSLLFIPLRSTKDLRRRIKKMKKSEMSLEAAKIAGIIILTFFLSMEYYLPYAQSKTGSNFFGDKGQILSSMGLPHDPGVKEVMNLAGMIRFITDDQLSEGKALRYAGLIYHAAQKYAVNPLEIIALIMAESRFKESSINAKSGDYGLGQINWTHWGKDYGLTPQELLDPAINIYMTCHVYKYFGKDFGKYHRGYGVKSKAYVVNVKSILSSLVAFAELNPDEAS